MIKMHSISTIFPYVSVVVTVFLITFLTLVIPAAMIDVALIEATPKATIDQLSAGNVTDSIKDRAIILTFDDAWKSQYSYAIPILNKYGFKGTFFVVCNYVGGDDSRMSWKDIEILRTEGHDIQAHTMNHKNLSQVSTKDLEFELGESKRCLRDHGYNSTIAATPFNEGWDNSTVIGALAKHYELARNGNAGLMFLKCDKWDLTQTDCSTLSNNGTLTFANRYSIRGWSHNFYDNKDEHNETDIFNEFVQAINKQQKFNEESQEISAIPIIIYHNFDNTRSPYTTTVDLFEMEMKYLDDNGFKVFPMSALKFDNNTNYLYLSGGEESNITETTNNASLIED